VTNEQRASHHDHGPARLGAGPASAFGPAPNEQGYYVGRVERNLYWVTDGVYQAAFLTPQDGVVLFDAPPSIGHNLQRAIEITLMAQSSDRGQARASTTAPDSAGC
jgi:hypothetical protein